MTMKLRTTENHSLITAIARQSRRGNGNCAEIEREIERTLNEIESNRRHVSWLENMLRMSKAPLAELKNDLPEKPGFARVAVFECGEVHFMWENESTDEIEEMQWPFVTDYVWPDDCEAAGFRIE